MLSSNPLMPLLIAALAALVVAAAVVVRAALLQRRAVAALDSVRVLLDGAAEARCLTDAKGRVTAANAAARVLWGEDGTPLEVLGTQLAAGDDDTAEAFARLRAAAEAGVPEHVELTLAGEAGPLERWAVAVTPVHGATLRGTGALMWTAEDVTARRAIEEVLIRERDELSEFLYFAPVGLYSADVEGRLRFVNQRLAEWLEYEADELAGRPLTAIVADGEVPRTEGGWRGEITFVTRSGRSMAALVHQSTYDDAGEIRTRTAVVPDSRPAAGGPDAGPDAGPDHRFRWLFEETPVGLCLLDLEGTVTDCNPAFVRMAGIGRDALLDRPLHDVLMAEDRGDLDALMQRVALGAAPGVHREVRLAPNPDTAAALYIGPMGAGAGIDGLVAHFIDTTAQRNLEEQFAQAQKMQAMGQLAGGVAHDFNNLLTAMIGFCDLLLQRHGAGDPSFADIMQIKQNANRGANLVRQLLAFSRKQPLRPRLVDITDALGEMSHLLRRLLGESVRLDMKHGRDVGMARVDPGQFDQVIINLAVNARDAMPGGGRLMIRTRTEVVETPFTRGVEHVPAGDYAVVTVADTGVGIPRENLGRIFEPFFSTKTGSVGAGTGLGLSTVYGIIRQTGGFVFVDSVPGQGTEFTIYLPKQEAEPRVDVERRRAPRLEAPAAGPAPESAASDLTGGGTIMLVEDEDAVRVFACRALRNKGYTVIEARTGEQAQELLAESPAIDLLITDMVMPGIDGATLARQVKRDHPELQVILISGYSEEAARGEIAESADFHFLPKPFSLNQLAAKVKDVLALA